jgi:hypothetical protein
MDELQAWQYKFSECLGIKLNDLQYFKMHHLLVPTTQLYSR